VTGVAHPTPLLLGMPVVGRNWPSAPWDPIVGARLVDARVLHARLMAREPLPAAGDHIPVP
jgi:hypothetical protein